MTTQCPDDISVPQVALDRCDHADYWILDGNTVYHNGEEKDIEVDVDLLRVGQTVGCMVSSDGELHVYIDGVDKCVLWTGLPTHKPFWGLADVCECTTRIKLLPGEWKYMHSVVHIVKYAHVHASTSLFFPLRCSGSSKQAVYFQATIARAFN